MRQLFIPACICLAAWSGAVGPESTPPIEASANAPIDHFKITGERRQPATDGSGHSAQIPQHDAMMKVASLEQPAQEEKPSTADNAAAGTKTGTGPANETDSVNQKQADSAAAHGAVRETVGLGKAKPKDKKVETPKPPKPVVHHSTHEICQTVAKAARNNDVPVPFFIRLLFQESRFKAAAVSQAGAQGIAQFMPGTAAKVGLDNPFDPLQAIPAAARLLHNLIDDFGNLGLAAAAYNAGPTRVHNWLSKKSHLPKETRGYVKAITGRPAETWKTAATGHSLTRLPERAPCKDVAGLYAWNDGKKVPLPPPAPIVQRDTVVAKNDGNHKAPSKAVKSVKADKAVRTAKAAKEKSSTHASKGTKQAAQKDDDAIQLAARKRKHPKRTHHTRKSRHH